MTIAYPVTTDGRFVIGSDDATICRTALGTEDRPTGNRIAAALNYTQDLTDDQLTEDSAATVLEDRDRLLAALRILMNHGSCAPWSKCPSCDAARDALQGR